MVTSVSRTFLSISSAAKPVGTAGSMSSVLSHKPQVRVPPPRAVPAVRALCATPTDCGVVGAHALPSVAAANAAPPNDTLRMMNARLLSPDMSLRGLHSDGNRCNGYHDVGLQQRLTDEYTGDVGEH